MKKLFLLCILALNTLVINAYEVTVSMEQTEESVWTFSFSLSDNDLDFTAFQLDVALEGESTVPEEGLEASGILSNHVLALGNPTGRLRVLCYSTTNAVFKKQNGSLFSFQVKGDPKQVSINKILFVEPNGKSHVAEDVVAVTVEDETTIKKTKKDKNGNGKTYDLSGRKVQHLKGGAIFIIDGKKVMVK